MEVAGPSKATSTSASLPLVAVSRAVEPNRASRLDRSMLRWRDDASVRLIGVGVKWGQVWGHYRNLFPYFLGAVAATAANVEGNDLAGVRF